MSYSKEPWEIVKDTDKSGSVDILVRNEEFPICVLLFQNELDNAKLICLAPKMFNLIKRIRDNNKELTNSHEQLIDEIVEEME